MILKIDLNRKISLLGLVACFAISACGNHPKPTQNIEEEASTASDKDTLAKGTLGKGGIGQNNSEQEKGYIKPIVLDLSKDEDITRTERYYFAFNRSDLSQKVQAELQDSVKRCMENDPQLKIVVAGHADVRGSHEYNMALGERRALSVKKYLTSQGLSPSRMKAISYGKERPETWAFTEAGHAKNRRVEVSFSS